MVSWDVNWLLWDASGRRMYPSVKTTVNALLLAMCARWIKSLQNFRGSVGVGSSLWAGLGLSKWPPHTVPEGHVGICSPGRGVGRLWPPSKPPAGGKRGSDDVLAGSRTTFGRWLSEAFRRTRLYGVGLTWLYSCEYAKQFLLVLLFIVLFSI